jgi:hypothetical protein
MGMTSPFYRLPEALLACDLLLGFADTGCSRRPRASLFVGVSQALLVGERRLLLGGCSAKGRAILRMLAGYHRFYFLPDAVGVGF